MAQFTQHILTWCVLDSEANHKREALSGVLLFRLELLPMFRQIVDNQDLKSSLLFILAYWENTIKTQLSGDLMGEETSTAPLSEKLREHDPWWRPDFSDTVDRIRATVYEYKLCD
ncbi:hypothetical protein PFISCL1PPCAC_8655 [Pristionchus fissidentatus]|uniref:Uncharacterized protein n=1 Tax=Pristionchus fissidentatus TaxID=1538716 RepID=A0AAV5VDK2_9BILA|nr:hypothetical protein PFISCL1PPCAC_8655 [Pristionchus fissidentatus]